MYENEDDLIERVSDDDEGNDDDAMDEDDGNGQQERSRSGRDVPADDGEPQLDGYARCVALHACFCWQLTSNQQDMLHGVCLFICCFVRLRAK